MSTNTKRVRKCTSCNNQAKRYGRTAAGTVRYRCTICLKTFVTHQKRVAQNVIQLKLLEEYVLYGATYKLLAKVHHLPKESLCRKFHKLLIQEPPQLVIPETQKEESYLIIDGKWFGKTEVALIYRRADLKTILRINFLKKEYGSQIAKDLEALKKQYHFTCVVSDGGTGIKKAVKQVLNHIPHQHCLAHLHREAIGGLGKYPKENNLKQLRNLADHLWLIESRETLLWWQQQLKIWIKRNKAYLLEHTHDSFNHRWWYTHKGARKAVRVLLTAPQTSFVFLDHPLLPKTSNALEASIGVLGDKKRIHRGLKKCRNQQFIKWFVYFYNQEKLAERKTYEDKISNTIC